MSSSQCQRGIGTRGVRLSARGEPGRAQARSVCWHQEDRSVSRSMGHLEMITAMCTDTSGRSDGAPSDLCCGC